MDFNNNMLFWFFAICGLIAGYIIIKDDNDRLKKKEMENKGIEATSYYHKQGDK